MNPHSTVTPGLEALRELVAEVLDVPVRDVGDDTDFVKDLGIDSLMALEVLVVLERRYQVTLEDAELEHLTSLANAHRLIAARLESER
jgi:acyl carrier protein